MHTIIHRVGGWENFYELYVGRSTVTKKSMAAYFAGNFVSRIFLSKCRKHPYISKDDRYQNKVSTVFNK